MPANYASATAVALQEERDPAEFEMRVIHLNLSDIEELIRGYERRYHVSTVQMLSNKDVRAKISEDDLLEWEAYVNQRSMLREHYERMHREYLQQRGSSRHGKTAEDDPAAYAA